MTRTVRNPFRLAVKLAAVCGPVLARHYRPDCCIAAARVTIDVFAEFGLVAVPVPTQVVVWNPAYRKRVLDGRPCRGPEELARAWDEDGSWALGIGLGGPPVNTGGPGYDGHLVVAAGSVPERSALIDLSLGQASRPTRDMVLGPAVVKMPPSFWSAADGFTWVDVNRCAVGYRVRTGRTADSYRDSPDWADPDRHTAASEELIRLCRLVKIHHHDLFFSTTGGVP